MLEYWIVGIVECWNYGILIMKPLVFKGNRLVLNIDTETTGYAQVGFLDQRGRPIKGFFSGRLCLYRW